MAKIFYFTGTGNCYSVASRLGEKLDAELVSITNYLAQPYIIEDDVIGVVTPVYSTDLPSVVVNFLEQVQLKGTRYIFCVATMGAMAGRTLYHVKDILHKRRLILNAGFTVTLPDNSIIFPSGEKRMQMLLGAEEANVNKIGELLYEHEENSVRIKDFFLWKIVAAVGMWTLKSILNVNHKKINKDKCNGCGICAKICPAGCITMEKDHPVFGEGCLTCFGCAQWCPNEAINLGWLHPTGNTKYVHPGVTIQDISGRRVLDCKK